MSKKKIYNIITIAFIIISLIVLALMDKTDSTKISLVIQIIMILYLIKMTYGSVLYVKKQYSEQHYSYKIIMILALIFFFSINIARQIDLLIENWGLTNIVDIYNNTLESFSYFAMLILPCIIVLSLYGVITNIFLIKKEGFRPRNLLAIILCIFTFIGLFGGQIIYTITNKLILSSESLIVKKFCDLSLNAILSYFYCLILATLYCNIVASRHNPKDNMDFVIILGSKIKSDGTVTPLLQGRCDRALSFAKEQKEKYNKNIVFVASGGQGSDEVTSEAEAIKKYLMEQGIKEKNIIVENKSTSTKENMRFSKNLIDNINKEGKIAFSTTNYHVFRSGVIATDEGLICEGMGSKTKWYFYTNALIREFVANLFIQKKAHLIMITLINLSLLVLVLIGYYYKFFLD